MSPTLEVLNGKSGARLKKGIVHCVELNEEELDDVIAKMEVAARGIMTSKTGTSS